MDLYNIKYSICNFKIVFNEDSKLNYNKTSAIRGIIGQELISRHCINNKQCTECLFNYNCLPFNFFNMKLRHALEFLPSDRTPPYIIICDNNKNLIMKGEELQFSIIFFSNSISMIPEVIRSIAYAGSDLGLYNKTFDLKEVCNDRNEHIFKDNKLNINKIKYRYINQYIDNRLNISDNVSLIQIVSPIRFKKDGKFANDITSEDLINLLVRRIATLNALEGNNIDITNNYQIKIIDKELFWKEKERYSNRQKNKMKLGGLVGNITIEVNDILTKKLLIAGELVHIGKSTAFGLGDYILF